jgi:hypothetical protein
MLGRDSATQPLRLLEVFPAGPRSGAKVFAAGALTIGGAAAWQRVTRLLDNLWRHLERP